MSQVLPQAPARSRGRPPIPGLRQDILGAAEDIFAQRDFHEVQMDEVAAACGIGKGTLYRYFGSKRDLYLAVMFEGVARLRAELEAALDTNDAPARRIEGVVRRTLQHFWDRRSFFALIHRHEPKRDADARQWQRQREQLSAVFQGTIDAAIAAGHLRPGNSRIATELLLGMIRGVNRYRRADDSLEDLVAAVVDVFMGGVGTPAGRRVLARKRRT